MRVYYRRHKFKGRKWIERLEGLKLYRYHPSVRATDEGL